MRFRRELPQLWLGRVSANVVGGQFVFMKTHGRCIDEMCVLEPAAMKVAFGENPKTNYGDQGQSPATRMAIAAMLREELFRAKQYWEKKKKGKQRNKKRNDLRDFFR